MNLVASRPESRSRRQAGEPEQMRPRIRVEPERVGDPVEHLRGRIPLPPLLEPRVVVGAHHRQYCDLFTPQANDPPVTTSRQTDRAGVDPGPFGPQERSEIAAGSHGSQTTRRQVSAVSV